jgi:hypothetical protein
MYVSCVESLVENLLVFGAPAVSRASHVRTVRLEGRGGQDNAAVFTGTVTVNTAGDGLFGDFRSIGRAHAATNTESADL